MSVVRGNNNNLLITLPPVPQGEAYMMIVVYQGLGVNNASLNIVGYYNPPSALGSITIDTASLPQGWTYSPVYIQADGVYQVTLHYTDVYGNNDQYITLDVPSPNCSLQVNSIFSAGAAVVADVTTNTVNPTNLTMSITNPTTGAISSSPYGGQSPLYPPGSLFYYSGVMMPVSAGQNRFFIFCYDDGYNMTPNVNLTLDGCSTVVTPIDYSSPTWITTTNIQDPIFQYIANNPPIEAKPLGYRKSGYTSSSSDNSMLYMILIIVILWMILSRKKR